MLSDLSPLELGRLRMSVGYGTHKKGRPLSPMEVASLLGRARNAGMSLAECAKSMQLESASYVGRFLRLLKLPPDLQHLISWGAGKGGIGFSAAVELVRLQNDNDQRAVAEAILTEGLNSGETRQVVQLKMRSEKSIDECLKEILNMRPKIQKRYVFIGSVADRDIKALGERTQNERNSILKSSIEYLGLQNASGQLGKQFFTLVGDEAFEASMRNVGKETIEERLRDCITEALRNISSKR